MGHNGGVAGAVGDIDGFQCFGERADLVDLDEDGVGGAGLDAAAQADGVGDKQIVSDQLHFRTQALGEQFPAVPIILGAAVLDAASSEFYDAKTKKYIFKKSDGSKKTAEELIAYYPELQKKFPIISIEDGCSENDWPGWKKLTAAMGKDTQIVGDDVFVTNTSFLRRGIEEGTANSILVKVNQIGTLTETLDAIELAKEHAYTAVISHRSGETEDTTIADIAVATNAGQIKTGSLCRTDRVAKYNQLLRIEEELGDNAIYGGKMR